MGQAQAKGAGRLQLAPGHGRQASAHRLGQVGGRKEGEDPGCPPDPIGSQAPGQEEAQDVLAQEEQGDQGGSPDELDVNNRAPAQQGQGAASPQGQQHTQGCAEQDRKAGFDQGEQQPTPLVSANGDQPQATANQHHADQIKQGPEQGQAQDCHLAQPAGIATSQPAQHEQQGRESPPAGLDCQGQPQGRRCPAAECHQHNRGNPIIAGP